jgi:hypothetical protein
MIELGLQLGMSILFWGVGILFLVAVIPIILSFVTDSDGWGGFGIGVGVFWLIGLIVLAVAAFPYNPAYWKLYSTSGTVESVSNGFAEGDGDMTWRSFVVTLEGDSTPYVLTDPRASQLDGKDVRLTCEKEFVYQAADRINCTIAEVK